MVLINAQSNSVTTRFKCPNNGPIIIVSFALNTHVFCIHYFVRFDANKNNIHDIKSISIDPLFKIVSDTIFAGIEASNSFNFCCQLYDKHFFYMRQ